MKYLLYSKNASMSHVVKFLEEKNWHNMLEIWISSDVFHLDFDYNISTIIFLWNSVYNFLCTVNLGSFGRDPPCEQIGRPKIWETFRKTLILRGFTCTILRTLRGPAGGNWRRDRGREWRLWGGCSWGRSVGLFFSLVFYNTIWQNYAPVESLAVQENNYTVSRQYLSIGQFDIHW